MVSRRVFLSGTMASLAAYGSRIEIAQAYDPLSKNIENDLGLEKFGASKKVLGPFATNAPYVELALIIIMGADNNLSNIAKADLDEIRIGVPPGLAVLVFADYETSGGEIYEITFHHGLRRLKMAGEVDTGDPETIATFLGQALLTYPLARKIIGFWNHGTGIFDESDSQEMLIDIALLHDNSGGVITNAELGALLKASFVRAGQAAPVDAIFFDADLNGMIEVFEELRPYADCIVAPPDLEPANGWDYQSLLSSFKSDLPKTGEDFAKLSVKLYCETYKDDEKSIPTVLCGYRSGGGVVSFFAELVKIADKAGNEGYFEFMDQARSASQSYADRPSYDLLDFCEQLTAISTRAGKEDLTNSAKKLSVACQTAVIANCALGPTVQRSRSFGFWFPSTRKEFDQDSQTYRKLAFAKATGWADYLDRHLPKTRAL